MTETDLIANPQATALAATFEPTRAASELAACHGVLTPRELDAPELETAALVSGAALHDLGWMKRVDVRGPDRFRWLSGMVTNSVNDLFPGSGAWNLVLNPQGRIQGDLTVWRGDEEQSPQRRNPDLAAARSGDKLTGTPFAGESTLELEIAADQYERLMAHLNGYIIMDDVELIPLGEEQVGEAGSETALGLTGPQADEVLERIGLPVLLHPMSSVRVEWNGFDLVIRRGYGVLAAHYEFRLPSAGVAKLWPCLRTGGATPVGCASLDAFRIAEGIPAYGVDIAERDLPQETSQMRALHFNKGCYLGQEIVERIRSRGNVHRHLRPLELTGPLPAPGTALALADGKPAGHITSAAELPLAAGCRAFALAMIGTQAETADAETAGAQTRNQPLHYTSGSVAGTGRILAAPPVLHHPAGK
ncbi:MAG TPA: folate-binding protein [Terracidiphilus sp.]|jgi:folate-binding protein YgfZ|nr:folate-binding protein [Terracidiphilus sp.]